MPKPEDCGSDIAGSPPATASSNEPKAAIDRRTVGPGIAASLKIHRQRQNRRMGSLAWGKLLYCYSAWAAVVSEYAAIGAYTVMDTRIIAASRMSRLIGAKTAARRRYRPSTCSRRDARRKLGYPGAIERERGRWVSTRRQDYPVAFCAEAQLSD